MTSIETGSVDILDDDLVVRGRVSVQDVSGTKYLVIEGIGVGVAIAPFDTGLKPPGYLPDPELAFNGSIG